MYLPTLRDLCCKDSLLYSKELLGNALDSITIATYKRQ
jgi:hypothetical protein